jgi:hypothetical protein
MVQVPLLARDIIQADILCTIKWLLKHSGKESAVSFVSVMPDPPVGPFVPKLRHAEQPCREHGKKCQDGGTDDCRKDQHNYYSNRQGYRNTDDRQQQEYNDCCHQGSNNNRTHYQQCLDIGVGDFLAIYDYSGCHGDSLYFLGKILEMSLRSYPA